MPVVSIPMTRAPTLPTCSKCRRPLSLLLVEGNRKLACSFCERPDPKSPDVNALLDALKPPLGETSS